VFATFEGPEGSYGEFSPDGKMWAMHGTDGNIGIWDVLTKKGHWPIVLGSFFMLLVAAGVCWRWMRTRTVAPLNQLHFR
jgi:hypothetical protein